MLWHAFLCCACLGSPGIVFFKALYDANGTCECVEKNSAVNITCEAIGSPLPIVRITGSDGQSSQKRKAQLNGELLQARPVLTRARQVAKLVAGNHLRHQVLGFAFLVEVVIDKVLLCNLQFFLQNN